VIIANVEKIAIVEKAVQRLKNAPIQIVHVEIIANVEIIVNVDKDLQRRKNVQIQ
jgi:hypothetical protein